MWGLLGALWAMPVAFSDSKMQDYQPRGVGGGGALSGFTLSPYGKAGSRLRFVGTDMGTLFRSQDEGKSWRAIAHDQVVFDYNLERSSGVGLSSDGRTVFFASGGKNPKRSLDQGALWTSIAVPLEKDEWIKYWLGDHEKSKLIFCATNQALYRSEDLGSSWKKVQTGESRGTFIQSGIQAGALSSALPSTHPKVFHATETAIFLSNDDGKTFQPWFKPSGTEPGANVIRGFAGGADAQLRTLAWMDGQGKKACAGSGDAATQAECGFVWVSRSKPDTETPSFVQTKKEAGRFIRMAENDPKTLYITGGNWIRQTGSKVWVSRDAGESWALRFLVNDWDKRPYAPWPKEKLEYSAVGLDVGWYDGAFWSFAINPRDSSEVGGTGHFFLHTSSDYGATWKAPFTQFADQGAREKGKKWRSTGIEVTSVHRLKFHPKFSKTGYASLADIGGLVTEDGGETWRITQAKYNTNYDYAFDPLEEAVVFAASGSLHDFPLGNGSFVEGTEGGVFRSNDRGRSWSRLTPSSGEWNIEFLSVAYDSFNKNLYGGTRGRGVARSKDGGKTWAPLNEGLPAGIQMVPQLEIDPANGNAYLLLTGDAPKFSNPGTTGIYFLDVANGSLKWQLLRQTVKRPEGVSADVKFWWFPSAFAVDFRDPKRETLWLTDIESQGAWLASGVWKSEDRGVTWTRQRQMTHPTALTLDPKDSGHVFASGLYKVDGSWGEGGAWYSLDGGASWKKNKNIPLLSNLDGTVFDPNRAGSIFYLFFGGGMLYGPAPR